MIRKVFSCCLLLLSTQALASGVAIDKIYTPYVDAMEYELEYRALTYQDDNHALDDRQIHKLGFGHSLTDRWAAEVYVLGTNPDNGDFRTSGFELEARWQATEQGEYAVDTGFLFELEHENNNDAWELSTALLLTHEFGRLVASSNIYLIFERNDKIGSEAEMAGNFQLLYRFNEHFEPAIELYRAQDTFGIGPVLTGTERLGIRKKLHWEFGIIAGLVNATPNATIKGLLEYEF